MGMAALKAWAQNYVYRAELDRAEKAADELVAALAEMKAKKPWLPQSKMASRLLDAAIPILDEIVSAKESK